MYCNNCMNEIKEGTICTECMNNNATPPQPHHLAAGTILSGKYLVGNAIGEGGFGITYIGRDTTLDIKVAIKEYFPNGYVNRNFEYSSEITATTERQRDFFDKGKERFLLEARSIAKFNQEKGIVDVRDYFEENGTAYIIMEYLDGETLSKHIKENGNMDAVQLFTLMKPVMKSLEKMHEHGIIHRDISPDNIMYQKNGALKLMDFGSARYFNNQDNALSIVLKMGYAPEEQYRKNGNQGPWTDVYAMCATIYRCITGKVPDESLDRLHADNLTPPTKLGVEITKPLEAVLMYGLAVRKENRCQSMTELLEITEKALSAEEENVLYNQEPTPYKTVAVDDVYKTQAVEGDFLPNTAQNYNQSINKPHPDNTPPQNKKDNGLMTGLIVAVVAMLIVSIAVLIGVILYASSRNDDDVEETTVVETQVMTEAPTEAPTEKPTEKPKKKGVAVYTEVIEDALSASPHNDEYARGYLYDLNSDGDKELVMIYDTNSGASCVTSVYTMDDSGAVPLLYEKELYDNVGGPFGCISIVKENGKILFCTNGETGETSGYKQRYGFWDLYSFDGDELEIEYESTYEYYSNGSYVDYESSSAKVNGKSMSYSAYKNWLDDGLDLVAYMSYSLSGVRENGYYSPNSTALSLEDLLSKVKK